MKAIYFSTVVFLLSGFQGHTKDVEEQLVVVRQDQKYSDAGKPTDIVIECLAKPEDVLESEKWHPYSDKLPVPLKLIIEVAHENLKVPDGKLVYVKPKKYVKEPNYVDISSTFSPPPDLRGIDLRGLNENLWCWEVYFGLHLDRSIESQASIRGGDLILSAKVLPNGGKVIVRERKMTSKERILFGLESDPNVTSPFAPQRRNKSVEVR